MLILLGFAIAASLAVSRQSINLEIPAFRTALQHTRAVMIEIRRVLAMIRLGEPSRHFEARTKKLLPAWTEIAKKQLTPHQ